MRLNKLFAALCAIAALSVSCQKEIPSVSEEQINVPEGMKYVSFELGTEDSKINGNPVSWNSAAEDVAVLGLLGGQPVTYKFQTESGTSAATKKISGTVDIDAELLYVVYPYQCSKNGETIISPTVDAEGKIHIPFISKYSYAKVNGIANETPYACKILNNQGTYSAASNLKPLFSLIKVTVPQIAEDHTNGDKDKPTSYMSQILLQGTGIAGDALVDFSGDTPVTTLEKAEEGRVQYLLKTNTTSNLPEVGYYLLPVVPGEASNVKFTLKYAASSKGETFADYSTTLSSFTFKQGKFHAMDISAPFVTSATTLDPTVDGTTLTMAGSAIFYTGGPVDASAYKFGFRYRAKGSEDWTSCEATYGEASFTATATVSAGTTYEVKAFATALNALKDGDGTKDQEVEGEVLESKGYVPPIVETILVTPTAYGNGGCWEYIGSDPNYVFPVKKQDGRVEPNADKYNYYAKPTDTTPLTTVIVAGGGTATSGNSYFFAKEKNAGLEAFPGYLQCYGGYFIFDGKKDYKITEFKVYLYASTLNKDWVLTSPEASVTFSKSVFSKCTGGTLIGKATYDATTAKEPKTLVIKGAGDADKGAKLWFGTTAYFINGFEITYTHI